MGKRGVSLSLTFLMVGTFILIALGGSVRAMHAGLACPDWPLCFGKVIPEFQVQVYFEFIHRVLAGLIALLSLFVGIKILRNDYSKAVKYTILISWAVLIAQIILGGLTVLKLLHFGVVTAHLIFGLTFFGLVLWARMLINDPPVKRKHKVPNQIFYLFTFSLLVVLGQIILGGLVSSNYAGLACIDFPLCNGELIPTLKGTLGLQVLHRLGAYATAITLFSLYLIISKHRHEKWMQKRLFNRAGVLVILTFLQILVGAGNVLLKIPPVITVVHLALATLIWANLIRGIYISRTG